MTQSRHNARYAKLRRQVEHWNWNRFQGYVELKVLKPGSLAFVIKEDASIINLPPVLINEVRIPFRLKSYCRTEVGAHQIGFCSDKRLGYKHYSPGRLRRASARLLYNDVARPELMLRKRSARKISHGNGAKVMRFNRYNICSSNAISVMRVFGIRSISTPISADEFANSIK